MQGLKCLPGIALVVAGLGMLVPLQVDPQETPAPPAQCTRTTYMGVEGCELLADGNCPAGYHKQSVGPMDPRMKAPTRLMCVADESTPAPKIDTVGPPKHAAECTPITYFGVTGCPMPESGRCLKGRHKKWAGPRAGSKSKAPLRLLCVLNERKS